MKARNFIPFAFILLFLSGCVVYSFYPLYNEKDLFENKILLGNWMDEDSSMWSFTYPKMGNNENSPVDKTGYELRIKEKDEPELSKGFFDVKVIKLQGHYFLDFYLKDIGKDDLTLFDFHIIPVHTFAKLTIEKDSVIIQWFNQDWMKELIKENKIRIHHEDNGEIVLLTAKPDELQKFVIKYVNSEEAFKDGLGMVLKRIND
jgi:hypothetical protein